MLICDLHSDLPYKILTEGETIESKNTDWSLNKTGENSYIQVFANFIDKFEFDNPLKTASLMIDGIAEQIGNSNKIFLIKTRNDLEDVLSGNKNGAIFSIEGGEALGGDLENLYKFYEKGVRILTLTWNYPNQLGEGVGEYTSNRGLTDFGKKVVREMNKINMAVDVSHLTESGFYDVAQECVKPFIASHSNSKKVCSHKRNLTDEQFLEIVKRKGVVGINFYPVFLSDDGKAGVTDIVRHIEHFMSLGGENSVCMGSDFDGIEYKPDGIKDISEIDNLISELLKINYKEELIAKLMHKNAIDYLKQYVF